MAADDDPLLPDPAAPVALYEGPRLRLFRGWGLVGFVLCCVLAGALGREALLHLPADPPPTPPPRPALARAGAPLLGATLPAAGGGELALPAHEPVLVNVWLQNCRDCMPAFAAWRAIVDEQRLPSDIQVRNVAYGNADLAWAKEWRVDAMLAFDGGAALVQPLGISSFTTLVIDRHGRVLLRDRPDAPGFVDRVQGALQAAWAQPDARVPPPAPVADPPAERCDH